MSDIYDPQFVKAVFDRCSDRYMKYTNPDPVFSKIINELPQRVPVMLRAF